MPTQVTSFLLTLAISTLIGIGLRDYYEGEGKYDTFGTVRTFVFLGLLGYMLYQIPEIGKYAYLMGLAAVVPFLLIYYSNKIRQKKSPGLIGVLIALLTYVTGPVAVHQPHWYLVLFGVSLLFVLHSKGRIRRFTDRLETGEVVTVCKFLAIAGVVLPLIPALTPTTGWQGMVFHYLPVTPRQIWMAVVITTTISYAGYVVQTYLFPRKGLLLAGLLGGLYSSTAAVLVLAKRSRQTPGRDRETAASILLAVSMMYLRILVLVLIFRIRLAIHLAPVLLILSALAAGYALWVRREGPHDATPEAPVVPEEAGEPTPRKNPLEINSALFFAFMFIALSVVTKHVLLYFKDMGLRALSFVVGFSDITPFVVSVLQSNLTVADGYILQAILISSASNNCLKIAYTYFFGTRRTANHAAIGMGSLAALTVVYALIRF